MPFLLTLTIYFLFLNKIVTFLPFNDLSNLTLTFLLSLNLNLPLSLFTVLAPFSVILILVTLEDFLIDVVFLTEIEISSSDF